jgi:hypothetical protein
MLMMMEYPIFTKGINRNHANESIMSIISVVSVSSASSAMSSAISMTSVTGLAIGGVAATIFLIFLLSSQEIMSASSYWNKKIKNAFNTVTMPLLIVFLLIVIYKVNDIV